MNETIEALLSDGAVRVPGVFHGERLEALRAFCSAEADRFCRMGPRDKDAAAAPVSPTEPLYLAAIQRGAEVLSGLGLPDLRFLAGAMIPKWMGEGRRGWHVDWWGWENTRDTWREIPPQVGLLAYLDDAMADTGALLIVPGSHRREVHGHFDTWGSWEPHPDEDMIEAKAGDAVLLDPRTLHAVTGNSATPHRLCLTLWFLLDYQQLEAQTRSTVMLSIPPAFEPILGDLCPRYDGPECWSPHVKKPQFPITHARIDALRNGRTDSALLEFMAQAGDDFIAAGGTFEWYFAAAAAKAPRKILELGTKYGYSAVAMGLGARWAGVDPFIVSVDAEADGIACNAIAKRNLELDSFEFRQVCMGTESPDLYAAIEGDGRFDIVHVDADHSPEGIRREMSIAMEWIKPNGLILVDDVDAAHVRDEAERFADSIGVTPFILPTVHGLMVINMALRTRWERMNR